MLVSILHSFRMGLSPAMELSARVEETFDAVIAAVEVLVGSGELTGGWGDELAAGQ